MAVAPQMICAQLVPWSFLRSVIGSLVRALIVRLGLLVLKLNPL